MLHKKILLFSFHSSSLQNSPALPLKTFYSLSYVGEQTYENTFYSIFAPVKTVVNTFYFSVSISYSNDFNNTATITNAEIQKGGCLC